MESLITAIEDSTLNAWVLGSAWIWPLLEILHFIGLSLLLGSLIIADLRPLAFLGFGINLTTGFLFVIGDPARYFANIGFRVKMLLVCLAALNALWFYWKINPVMRTWDAHGDTPALAKTIAILSLGTWTGVLLLGRLIPYIGTG